MLLLETTSISNTTSAGTAAASTKTTIANTGTCSRSIGRLKSKSAKVASLQYGSSNFELLASLAPVESCIERCLIPGFGMEE